MSDITKDSVNPQVADGETHENFKLLVDEWQAWGVRMYAAMRVLMHDNGRSFHPGDDIIQSPGGYLDQWIDFEERFEAARPAFSNGSALQGQLLAWRHPQFEPLVLDLMGQAMVVRAQET
ncbi:MAG: hypothetical protein AAFY42_08300 [Pseudomonadota bacterium]